MGEGLKEQKADQSGPTELKQCAFSSASTEENTTIFKST